MKNIKNWPVMSTKCASCPFGEGGDAQICASVMTRLFEASQICHHPVLHGKKETHLCRGARDEQLTILHRMGWIPEPTDAAFAETSRKVLQ